MSFWIIWIKRIFVVSERDLLGKLAMGSGESIDNSAASAFLAASFKGSGTRRNRDQHDQSLHLFYRKRTFLSGNVELSWISRHSFWFYYFTQIRQVPGVRGCLLVRCLSAFTKAFPRRRTVQSRGSTDGFGLTQRCDHTSLDSDLMTHGGVNCTILGV